MTVSRRLYEPGPPDGVNVVSTVFVAENCPDEMLGREVTVQAYVVVPVFPVTVASILVECPS